MKENKRYKTIKNSKMDFNSVASSKPFTVRSARWYNNSSNKLFIYVYTPETIIDSMFKGNYNFPLYRETKLGNFTREV